MTKAKKVKPAKAKAKPRRVILNEGIPEFAAGWVSLVDRFGGRVFLRETGLRGKWVRLVAEVLK